MSATNSFVLVGVVNGDAEVVPFRTGNGSVTKVILTCQTQKFTGNGIEIDHADYEVSAYGKVGERLAQLVNGSTVSISGDISSRTWRSKDGKDGRSTELIAKEIAVVVAPSTEAF